MDLISLIMLILGLIGIFFGFLYGKKRGLCKATIRLVLIGVAALVAFLMRETITQIVLDTPIEDGKSILDLLTEGMASGEDAEKMEGFVNVITNILKMVLQIFVFVITFFALRISTLIIYWIVAAIVTSSQKRKLRAVVRSDVESIANGRKLSKKQTKLIGSVKNNQEILASAEGLDKKESRKVNKELAANEKKLVKKTVKRDRKKWWGSLVGVAQGVIVVICVVAPISCLVSNLGSLMKSLTELEMEGEKLIDESTSESLEEIGIISYPESTVAKIYTVSGGWLYRSISAVKNEDGTVVNIESQIEAVDGGVKMVGAVSKLSEVNFDEGFNEDVKDEIVGIFNELDEIKGEMSEESIEELDRLMKEALTPMLGESAEELPIDLEKIDFAEVDFATEGEVVSSFYELYEKAEGSKDIDEEEMMEDVITTLSESTLILPILSQMVEELPEDEKPNFSAEEKAEIEEIIDGLDSDNAEELKKLFGIN